VANKIEEFPIFTSLDKMTVQKGKSPLEPQPSPQGVEPKVRSSPLEPQPSPQGEGSPLEDIPYITADITTQEIVDLIRENRAGI
jgi:hypothetical protein